MASHDDPEGFAETGEVPESPRAVEAPRGFFALDVPESPASPDSLPSPSRFAVERPLSPEDKEERRRVSFYEEQARMLSAEPRRTLFDGFSFVRVVTRASRWTRGRNFGEFRSSRGGRVDVAGRSLRRRGVIAREPCSPPSVFS